MTAATEVIVNVEPCVAGECNSDRYSTVIAFIASGQVLCSF
jgi:hypothetical protein